MESVIIITGGSRGIGRATAIKAAAKGYAVVINYLSNTAAAGEVVDAIKAAGGKAVAVKADISQEADVINLFAEAGKLGVITALVNNAGIIASKQSTVAGMDAARLQKVFATNVTGSFICAREAVKRMSTKNGGKGGAIVNVSSKAAAHGSPFEYVDYAASKGAIDTFTIGLSKEVADEGIRVNAVRPGIIETEIHASGGEPNRVARIAPTLPMKRGGTADEVANTILWLLSGEASYITGALVDVAGGR
ncbi:MAG TPA: SDR family oxidoreductase [Chitinophagaceae bacterium]|nr:SDR family oxidoreductase [Chitinophagaceae bacterium]